MNHTSHILIVLAASPLLRRLVRWGCICKHEKEHGPKG